MSEFLNESDIIKLIEDVKTDINKLNRFDKNSGLIKIGKPYTYNNTPFSFYYYKPNDTYYTFNINNRKFTPISDSIDLKLHSNLAGYRGKLKDNNSTTPTNINTQNLAGFNNKPTVNTNNRDKILNNNKPTVNTNNEKWLSTWKNFISKYVNKNINVDKNIIFKFIENNKKLFKINLSNKEKVYPPYFYQTKNFPIFLYQKSPLVKEIQKKMNMVETGIFLFKTEKALIKRLNFKNTDGQGYNVKYNRQIGITKEIFDVIMSQDDKNLSVNKPEKISNIKKYSEYIPTKNMDAGLNL